MKLDVGERKTCPAFGALVHNLFVPLFGHLRNLGEVNKYAMLSECVTKLLLTSTFVRFQGLRIMARRRDRLISYLGNKLIAIRATDRETLLRSRNIFDIVSKTGSFIFSSPYEKYKPTYVFFCESEESCFVPGDNRPTLDKTTDYK